MSRIVTDLMIFMLLSVSCNSGKEDNVENTYDSSINLPELTVYEAPQGVPHNDTFSVYVKYEGGDWIDLYEYDADVDGGHMKNPVYHMAFVSFDTDFSKKIEVKVKKNDGVMSNVKIRPESAGIEPVMVDANTIRFSLTKPQKLSVEVNDDLHNNLMVFANQREVNPVSEDEPGVHWFGPGIHKLGDDGKGTLTLKNNEKIYIAGGAIVYGNIVGNNVNNVSISGRGILCGGMYDDHAYPHKTGARLLSFNNSTHVRVEGITLLNSVTWNVTLTACTDVVCKDLKIMGWTINSDGINPVFSSNVLIDDCFIRNYDDCISIKLGWAMGAIPSGTDSRNITVQNCILWTDQGRAIGFGPESYSNKDKVMEDMTIKNIDILYNQNYDANWARGVISILLGDDITMRNITFEDIRVDKIGDRASLFDISIVCTEYNKTPGKKMENIIFNRVSLKSNPSINNTIRGYDADRTVSGVSFTDLKINGVYIHDATSGNIRANDFTENISFKVNN